MLLQGKIKGIEGLLWGSRFDEDDLGVPYLED